MPTSSKPQTGTRFGNWLGLCPPVYGHDNFLKSVVRNRVSLGRAPGAVAAAGHVRVQKRHPGGHRPWSAGGGGWLRRNAGRTPSTAARSTSLRRPASRLRGRPFAPAAAAPHLRGWPLRPSAAAHSASDFPTHSPRRAARRASLNGRDHRRLARPLAPLPRPYSTATAVALPGRHHCCPRLASPTCLRAPLRVAWLRPWARVA